MKISQMLYLYRRLYVQQLKAILEYNKDFYILMCSAALTQVLGFVFLWVIYDRIPDIQGWQFWEVTFMYAMIFLTEGRVRCSSRAAGGWAGWSTQGSWTVICCGRCRWFFRCSARGLGLTDSAICSSAG